ncbi:hypothetical protein PCH_Pc03g00130 [Penicillium rubens Wisconsin 54-1255]|uniref:Uncharacterized protein n=1 Tax=Penicillium rubens (strain ATCC 28089 / DSM 1075 / NRRL 1951 / Wisconsin 54-1255) TaxID=500485 RepID=B6GVR2_PENRW|nr:hypothetical protein PCH_Pc03g00130 [Penicillium rubens Wisconsin 54-1255]
MDSPNSWPDQEKQGEQQPNEFPILNDNDHDLESSDHVPPLPSPLQHEEVTRHTLATEPFQPILKVLADLERDNPKFALPAARLVGLYRRLWESCVSKYIDVQKIDQSNEILKEAGMESSRVRLTSLLDDWNYPYCPNLAGLTDVAREDAREITPHAKQVIYSGGF